MRSSDLRLGELFLSILKSVCRPSIRCARRGLGFGLKEGLRVRPALQNNGCRPQTALWQRPAWSGSRYFEF